MGGIDKAKLQKRFISALILGPVALFLIYAGGPLFWLLLAVCAVIALYEWVSLAFNTKYRVLYSLLGVLYITGVFYCCFMIREDHGVMLSILFVLLVWGSDIGAYFAGKYIGGPKMAREISPNKTWAGLAGAMAAPYLICVLYFTLIGELGPALSLLAASAGLLIGFIGQCGDLLVSWIKRKSGTKDAGDLIPGHGGLLDRIDALMLSAPVYWFLISWFPVLF